MGGGGGGRGVAGRVVNASASGADGDVVAVGAEIAIQQVEHGVVDQVLWRPSHT
jgi:hypothetical protein